MAFTIAAVAGTAAALRAVGVAVAVVEPELGLPGVTLAMAAGRAATQLRRVALAGRVPCYTTIAGLAAGALAIERMRAGPLLPRSLREVQGLE